MPKPKPSPNTHSREKSGGDRAFGKRAKVVVVAPAHLVYSDVRVFQKEARTLASYGYEVSLYARAGGREQSFVDEDVRVVPITFPSRVGILVRMPKLYWKLLREKADVYHLHNPFSIPLALALKVAGKKVIYDVHEDYIERIRIREWLPRALRAPVGSMVGVGERLVGKVADGSIATQPEVVGRLGRRAILLENAPMVDGALIVRAEKFANEITDEIANPNGDFRIIYAGSISRVRGLPAMMDALNIVNKRLPARLWLIGSQDDEVGLADAKNHPAWSQVDYLGRLEHLYEVYGYMLRANVGFTLIRDQGGYARISSNKIYEYMAAGIPFIASAFPLWMERLAPISAGYFCDPTDAECAGLNIIELAQNPRQAVEMGERGREFVRSKFNWEADRKRLLDLYQRIIEGDDASSRMVTG